MPEFAFTAEDKAGNAVNGRVAADDQLDASYRIGRMGYLPVHVEPVEPQLEGVEPVLPTRAPAAPVEPVSDVTITAPPGAFGTGSPYRQVDPAQPLAGGLNSSLQEIPDQAHIEPWQRGGPLSAQPSVSAQTTQPITPVASTASVRQAPLASVPISGRTVGTGRRHVSFVELFKERMIYPVFPGATTGELAVMYRQWATLIGAGIPLHQSLHSLEASTSNKRLKQILQRAQGHVLAGGRLSVVLAEFPWIFPTMHTELIRAAEEGGFLETVLGQLAEYVEHEMAIRDLVRKETLWSKIVLVTALMILGAKFFWTWVPVIVDLVVQGDVSGYLWNTVGFGGAILAVAFAVVALFRLVLFNVPGVRDLYDQVKLKIPWLGNLIRMFALAKFNRTFAALYRCGMGMMSSLEIAGDSTGNSVISKAAYRAARDVEVGKLASDSLERSHQFLPMAIDMLRTGETSGSMDEMADSVADYYEKEGKLKAHQVSMIFTTIVYFLVAILVAIAVIQYYSHYAAGAMDAGQTG